MKKGIEDRKPTLDEMSLGHGIAAISDAIPVVVLFVIVLAVPISVAAQFDFGDAETFSWILVAWELPAIVSVVLMVTLRQLLLLTGTMLTWILIGSLSNTLEYTEVIGAMVITAVILIAFAVASSRLQLAGLGAPFWALLFGLVFSWVLERDAIMDSFHSRSVFSNQITT